MGSSFVVVAAFFCLWGRFSVVVPRSFSYDVVGPVNVNVNVVSSKEKKNEKETYLWPKRQRRLLGNISIEIPCLSFFFWFLVVLGSTCNKKKKIKISSIVPKKRKNNVPGTRDAMRLEPLLLLLLLLPLLPMLMIVVW
jgi:hypothetical protein